MRRVIAVVVVAAALVALRFAVKDHLEPRAALALLRSVQEEWWAVPAYVALYVAFTAAFVPAVLFHMVAAAAWGFGPGLVINVVTCNAAASLQFWLARRLGRLAVERWLKGARIDALEEKISREGLRAVLAIRVMPLPTMAVNMAGGVSSIRWRDFFLGSLIGTFPIILIYTYFAASLVEGVAGAERRALIQTLIAGALVLAAVVLPRLWARRRV